MTRYRLTDPSGLLVQLQELTRIVYQQGVGEEISEERARDIVREAFADWWPIYLQHVLGCCAGMEVPAAAPVSDDDDGDSEE